MPRESHPGAAGASHPKIVPSWQ